MIKADEDGIVYGKTKHDLGPCACWEEKDQLEDEEGYQRGPFSKSEEQDSHNNIYSYI